jgi:hypothetical protein
MYSEYFLSSKKLVYENIVSNFYLQLVFKYRAIYHFNNFHSNNEKEDVENDYSHCSITCFSKKKRSIPI